MPTLKEVGTEFHIAERWTGSPCANDPNDPRMNADVAERTERPADANRSRHLDGPHVPRLLAPGAVGRGAAGERLPAGAREDAVGAAARLPRQRGQIRADRRILRPPRRVALVRPQRGAWPALLLSRLEIRRDRAVHRRPLRAARERLLPEDQAQVLPVGEARAGAVDLYGSAGEATAAAGMGIRDGAGRSDLHLQAPAGMQLAASHGGRN